MITANGGKRTSREKANEDKNRRRITDDPRHGHFRNRGLAGNATGAAARYGGFLALRVWRASDADRLRPAWPA
ncbi:hypothetical protein D3C72_1877390 [compost metagenome]